MQREVSRTTTISTVESGGKLARLASTSGGVKINMKVISKDVMMIMVAMGMMPAY